MKRHNRILLELDVDAIETEWAKVITKVGRYYREQKATNPTDTMAVERVEVLPNTWHVLGTAHGDVVGFRMDADPHYLIDLFDACMPLLRDAWPGVDFNGDSPVLDRVVPKEIALTDDTFTFEVEVAKAGVDTPDEARGDSPNVNEVRKTINEAIAEYEDYTEDGAPVTNVIHDALGHYPLGPVASEFDRMVRTGEIYAPSGKTVARTNRGGGE